MRTGRVTLCIDDTRTRTTVRAATSPRQRLFGLMGRRDLGGDDGLLLRPCGSVHTCFMRFPIDVVYLDRGLRVIKVAASVRPWRISLGGRSAHAAVELGAGVAEHLGLRPGVRVTMEDR